MKEKGFIKKLTAMGLCMGLLFGMTACSTNPPAGDKKTEDTNTDENAPAEIDEDSAASAGKKVEDLKIGTILISSSSQITASQGNAIKEHAESLGAECTLEYFDQNVATQANLIENAITAGVDILLVQNQSEGDCITELNKAAEAGITVVMYGDVVDDVNYTYHFAEDSKALGYEIGKVAAEWANENLVEKDIPVIAALGNYSVSPVAYLRYEGAREAIEEFCPEAEIVGSYEMAYKEEGLEAGENILQAHPDVNLVVGINDQSVCGVYDAFNAAGKADDNIGMFGIDGMAEFEYLIAMDTVVKATLDIDPVEVGRQMVDYAIAKATGDPNAEKEKTVYWEGTLIDQNNIQDYKDKWSEFAK